MLSIISPNIYCPQLPGGTEDKLPFWPFHKRIDNEFGVYGRTNSLIRAGHSASSVDKGDLFGKMCSKYLKTWGRRRGLVRCGKRGGGGGGAFKDSSEQMLWGRGGITLNLLTLCAYKSTPLTEFRLWKPTQSYFFSSYNLPWKGSSKFTGSYPVLIPTHGDFCSVQVVLSSLEKINWKKWIKFWNV